MATLWNIGSRAMAVVVLAIAACNSVDYAADWQRNKTMLIGMKYNDLLTCAGAPDQQASLDRNSSVLTYGHQTLVPESSISNVVIEPNGQTTPYTYTSPGYTSECQAFVSVRNDTVVSITERGNSPEECSDRFGACTKFRTPGMVAK